jgi:hypothetical protein
VDGHRLTHGKCSGRHGIQLLAAPALILGMACSSQKSAPIEQRKEPLATGGNGQVVAVTGSAHTPSPERPATVSSVPALTSDQDKSKTPPVEDLRRELRSTPDSVLVGTDVVPLSEFLNSTRPVPAPAVFRSEQGGATAEIELTINPSGTVLTRRFAEAGTEPQTKRYDSLRGHPHGVRLSSGGLEVLGVSESILVWEKRSGVEGIPDSLWIRYDLAPRNGADRR